MSGGGENVAESGGLGALGLTNAVALAGATTEAASTKSIRSDTHETVISVDAKYSPENDESSTLTAENSNIGEVKDTEDLNDEQQKTFPQRVSFCIDAACGAPAYIARPIRLFLATTVMLRSIDNFILYFFPVIWLLLYS